MSGGQPRPALGLVPWFAFLRRALTFFFVVFFDIGVERYAPADTGTKARPYLDAAQSTSVPASHVLRIRSGAIPWSTALSAP